MFLPLISTGTRPPRDPRDAFGTLTLAPDSSEIALIVEPFLPIIKPTSLLSM